MRVKQVLVEAPAFRHVCIWPETSRRFLRETGGLAFLGERREAAARGRRARKIWYF